MTTPLLDLWKDRFGAVPLYCGDENSTARIGRHPSQDWTARKTTDDQKRVEDYLAANCNPRDVVLHVGIGNSRLAWRFGPFVARIDGLTIQKNELGRALKLEVANYHPELLDKYSIAFSKVPDRQYRFILDNNVSSYCCCFFHFSRMMRTYRRLLDDNGELVTDRLGLGWVFTGVNPRWQLDWSDWTTIACTLDMIPAERDGSIYTMRRP